MNLQMTKLGEICEFINGDRGKNYPSGNDIVKEGVPFINAGHIQNNKINLEEMNYITEEKYNLLGSGKIKKGDIVYCLRGSLGKYGIISLEKGAIASSLVILRPNKCIVEPRFLMHYLGSTYIQKQIYKANNGSSQPNLSAQSVKNFDIYLPCLNIQNKIVNILDQAQELIDKRKAQIEALDELIQSVFYEIFGDVFLNRSGWKECFLEELCEEIVDCPHSTPIYSEGVTQYPCIRTSEISNGYIKWDSMKYLDEEEYFKRVKRLIPKPGDIVYAREGTFGDAIIIPNSTEMCLGQRVMLFRTKSDVNAVFFWGMIRSNGVYYQALNNTSGSTVGHVNIKDIKKFKCLVVPLELQNKFAEIVASIEKQKELLNESLVELENNFNSLMQRAFKGELF